MNEQSYSLLKGEVFKKLLDSDLNPKNEIDKNLIFEQYKLLIDSSHKIEESRKASNNIFLGINSLILTLTPKLFPASRVEFLNLFISIFLMLFGIILSLDWLKTIQSYKKINYINYLMISATEKYFPIPLFTLRADLSTNSSEDSEKSNVILNKETLLPVIFLVAYLISLIFLVIAIPF